MCNYSSDLEVEMLLHEWRNRYLFGSNFSILSAHENNAHCMSASISRVAGALCFNNGDSAEERLREFLAVSTWNELLSLNVCSSLGPVVGR